MDISPLFQSSEEVTTPEEVSFKGNLPSWLEGGLLLQIGPGLWDLSPTYSLKHLVDGYGILSKFSFSSNKVSFSSHYIQSEAYKKARETGLPQFTEFGSVPQASQDQNQGVISKVVASFSSMMKDDMSDNAGTSLFQIGDRCCVSAATNFFFDLELDCKNPQNSNGKRYDGKKILGQNGLGPHPLVDEDGTWWNMGFTALPSLKHNIIAVPGSKTCVNLDLPNFFKNGKIMASISSRWSGALAVNHSFGMTKSLIVFVEQPYVVKVSRVLASKLKSYSLKDWLEWRPEEGNKFHLIDKISGKRVLANFAILSELSFFFMHFLNCYEDEVNGTLVIDIATCPNPEGTEATWMQRLRANNLSPELALDIKIQRFVIPLKTLRDLDGPSFKKIPENDNILSAKNAGQGPCAYRMGTSTLMIRPINLTPSGVDQMSPTNPGWIGRKYSYFYGSGSFLSRFSSVEETPFANSVVKMDLDKRVVLARWFQSRRQFPGEPLFVSRISRRQECVDEDDGVILVAVRTLPNEDNFLLVLDAKSLSEIGRAIFKSRFPLVVHGVFITPK